MTIPIRSKRQYLAVVSYFGPNFSGVSNMAVTVNDPLTEQSVREIERTFLSRLPVSTNAIVLTNLIPLGVQS